MTDDTGANAGWSISLTSTTFTNAGRTFDTDAARITGASALANVGTCSAPTNTIASSYPLVIPADTPAPAAIKIVNAAAGSGRGTHDLDIAHSLRVPSRAATGTYSSTWTWTIASGP